MAAGDGDEESEEGRGRIARARASQRKGGEARSDAVDGTEEWPRVRHQADEAEEGEAVEGAPANDTVTEACGMEGGTRNGPHERTGSTHATEAQESAGLAEGTGMVRHNRTKRKQGRTSSGPPHAAGGTGTARKRKIAFMEDTGGRGRELRQMIRMGASGIRAIEAGRAQGGRHLSASSRAR